MKYLLLFFVVMLTGCITQEGLEDTDRYGMAKGASGGASAIQQPFTGRLDTSACGWGESGEAMKGSLVVDYENGNCRLHREIP